MRNSPGRKDMRDHIKNWPRPRPCLPPTANSLAKNLDPEVAGPAQFRLLKSNPRNLTSRALKRAKRGAYA